MSKLTNLFYEVGTLRHLKRSHNLHFLQPTESVAEHSHRAIIIAYVLAHEVGADRKERVRTTRSLISLEK